MKAFFLVPVYFIIQVKLRKYFLFASAALNNDSFYFGGFSESISCESPDIWKCNNCPFKLSGKTQDKAPPPVAKNKTLQVKMSSLVFVTCKVKRNGTNYQTIVSVKWVERTHDPFRPLTHGVNARHYNNAQTF